LVFGIGIWHLAIGIRDSGLKTPHSAFGTRHSAFGRDSGLGTAFQPLAFGNSGRAGLQARIPAASFFRKARFSGRHSGPPAAFSRLASALSCPARNRGA